MATLCAVSAHTRPIMVAASGPHPGVANSSPATPWFLDDRLQTGLASGHVIEWAWAPMLWSRM
jgi:hypothetical protein